MKHKHLRALALLLALLLTLSGCGGQRAERNDGALAETIRQTAAFLQQAVPEPAPGSIGGEWLIFGLCRSGADVPRSYYDGYYERLCAIVEEKQGVLDTRKNTEYSRTILALTALGKDPSDVAGYDLLLPLSDCEQTLRQGINGPIFALLALDSGGYDLPETGDAENQASRARYLAAVLEAQNDDGSWSLIPGEGDADLTAMALQALANYSGEEQAASAARAGLDWLAAQAASGGLVSYGQENAETLTQVIVALCALGVSPEDERFQNENGGLLEQLLRFAVPEGGFSHTLGGEADLMATEQALYALAAIRLAEEDGAGLYQLRAAPEGYEWRGGMLISTDTGKDRYGTDPVPEGKPLPVEPGDAAAGEREYTCTVSISCAAILDHMDLFDREKAELVPEDGWLLKPETVTFREGESAFDVLQRVCREKKLHMEFSSTPVYNSAYIEGIGNLYEFDAGDLSGWMYRVNGWCPNYGCSRYRLSDGDMLEWIYTCDLGRDVGGGRTVGGK